MGAGVGEVAGHRKVAGRWQEGGRKVAGRWQEGDGEVAGDVAGPAKLLSMY